MMASTTISMRRARQGAGAPQTKRRPSKPRVGLCSDAGETRSGRRCDVVSKSPRSNSVEGHTPAAQLSHGPSARCGSRPCGFLTMLGREPTSIPFSTEALRASLLRLDKSSPVTEWLRALGRLAHQECGGRGVGAIGICLTGGFALSMALDPVVLAQPGLPATRPGALDISPAGLDRVKARTRDGLKLRGYRFEGDTICRASRFKTLRTRSRVRRHGTARQCR